MIKEIVSLILERNGKVLVEKRKASKKTTPGCFIFPAGHVEEGETKEEALRREMEEELGIILGGLQLIHVENFNCEEDQKISFYACDRYEGDIRNNEAEELIWLPPTEAHLLSHEISRNALGAYKKMFLRTKNN